MKPSPYPPDIPLHSHSIAAIIGAEFGRLYRTGRGTIGDICREEEKQLSVFLNMSRAPITRGLLPSLWECTHGGYGVCISGRDGQGVLRFSDDLSNWRLTRAPFKAAGNDVVSLMSFMSYGRPIEGCDLAQLLGVATARTLIGVAGGAPASRALQSTEMPR